MNGKLLKQISKQIRDDTKVMVNIGNDFAEIKEIVVFTCANTIILQGELYD